ncbi:M15 family metallopeptidase [Herbidospora daliensis]|uniref:M15 family metallopeptidase n=1 Tax=Herbidospora daliensis TaxID=295585 RepID=UPI00078672B2|nr:M15 family metallopeptidase [Herbidospora daliensis]
MYRWLAPLLLTLVAACGPLQADAVGVADGLVEGHISPFDDSPAITNLDPALLRAVRQAARDAAADGVELYLTTAWRSERYQRKLYDEAITKYGSEHEARRYVSTPGQSRHVTGDAVDVGPTDADDWLNRHGRAYGLCQTYANEMWHFELATTPGGDCPPMRADASARR